MNKKRLEDIRAEMILEIMRKEEYSEGIKLKVLYKEVREHDEYQNAFNGTNANNAKQYTHSIRALLQFRAPLSKNFKGKNKDFFNIGIKSGLWTYYSNNEYKKILDTSKELSDKFKDIDKVKDAEDRYALVKIRLNQGKFRKNLIDEMKSYKLDSAIKKISNEKVLIASHIVDYKDCDSEVEKANYFNGLILSPDIDKLFDRKYISFDINGKIIINKNMINAETLKKMGIDSKSKLPSQYLKGARKEFLIKRNKIYNF